jgi:hypothetical protein
MIWELRWLTILPLFKCAVCMWCSGTKVFILRIEELKGSMSLVEQFSVSAVMFCLLDVDCVKNVSVVENLTCRVNTLMLVSYAILDGLFFEFLYGN